MGLTMSSGKRRHLFISHHHADDASVSKLTSMLQRSQQDVRNSSIRAKPANQRRLDKGMVKDETIRRLLRRKISWASTVVVVIGKETATRKWVNWEIDQANSQGKRIVGVFERGGTNADVPTSFEKYGSALVAWNARGIVKAIEGQENMFQNPDGTSRTSTSESRNVNC